MIRWFTSIALLFSITLLQAVEPLAPLSHGPGEYKSTFTQIFNKSKIQLHEGKRSLSIHSTSLQGGSLDVEVWFDESLNAQAEVWTWNYQGSKAFAARRWIELTKVFEKNLIKAQQLRGLTQTTELNSEGKRAKFGKRKVNGSNDIAKVVFHRKEHGDKDILMQTSLIYNDTTQQYQGRVRWESAIGEQILLGKYKNRQHPLLKPKARSMLIGGIKFYELAKMSDLLEWQSNTHFRRDAVYCQHGVVHSFMRERVKNYDTLVSLYEDEYISYEKQLTVPLKVYVDQPPHNLIEVNLPVNEVKVKAIQARLDREKAASEVLRREQMHKTHNEQLKLQQEKITKDRQLKEQLHQDELRRLREKGKAIAALPKAPVQKVIYSNDRSDLLDKPSSSGISWSFIFTPWFWLGSLLAFMLGVNLATRAPPWLYRGVAVITALFLLYHWVNGNIFDFWLFLFYLGILGYVLAHTGWYYTLKDKIRLLLFFKLAPEEFEEAQQEWEAADERVSDAEDERDYWKQKAAQEKQAREQAEQQTGSNGASTSASPEPFDPNNTKPWWEVLEVPENSDIKKIRSARNALLHKWAPDKLAFLGEELRLRAEEKTKEINHAFAEAEKLKNK